MEDMLIIPKGRKKSRTGRVCLLLGLTMLLFILIALRFGASAAAILRAQI